MSESTKAPGVLTILRSLLVDVGVPALTYFVAHWLGASDFVALLAGSLIALLRTLFVAARHRKFELFSAVMVGVFTVGLVLSFVTGDVRFLLVKESAGTFVAGVAFLVSCLMGKPLVYFAALRMQPAREAEFAQLWATMPQFRRSFTVMSAVWGFGLVFEALLRIPLVFVLPVEVMVTVSTVMIIAVFVLLAVWNKWYATRAQARFAELRAAQQTQAAPTEA
ncbi:VC0807 family protein [Kutzneria sp. 744]|uniref:VC0807 family protein n=1 Tax=Kutzneria sp. (strain 744) TaxID=345341 RepID=UPI0003EED029|nr:VC0807 family protein [Kutzneria sp. 744]EWM16022.1 membrane protein [Kutzneria sp. 744]